MGFRTEIKKAIEVASNHKVQKVSIQHGLRLTPNGKYKVMKIEVYIKNDLKT